MRKSVLLLFVLPVMLLGACGKGKEGEKASAPAKLAVSVPATPGGISTLAADGMVAVRWTASPGADSYNVYFSGKAGTAPEKCEKITGIKGTSHEHANLKNNTAYYYRISAVSAAGESAVSGETGAMPKSVPPGAPSGVAATGGTGAISVKWAPVQGVTSYNVYYSTKPQVARDKRTKVAGVKAPPYEHKDVKKKTMYFYVVSAVNEGGESPLSAESGAMP